MAFAYCVAKLKLFASISATDAKPQNVGCHCTATLSNNPQQDTKTFSFLTSETFTNGTAKIFYKKMSYILDFMKSILIFMKIFIDFIMKGKTKSTNVIWALVFAICFPISVFYLSKYDVQTPLSLLIIAVNTVLFVVFTAKQLQSIKSLDEVQIRIQLEAVSIAFILSLLVVMIFGMLGLVKELGLGKIDSLYIFALLPLFYILGLIISKRKYR